MGADDPRDRNRLITAGAVFAMLLVVQVVRDPGYAAVALPVTAAVAAAVFFAVRWFRRRVVSRVPERLADSPSRPVRVGTKVATGYATYLVGFYAAIAVLGLFTVLKAMF